VEGARLLETVGDPFQFTPDLPPQGEHPTVAIDYSRVSSLALLIEFTGSDLWRDRLCLLNFASREEVTFTEKGRRLAMSSDACSNESRASENHSLIHRKKLDPALRGLEGLG